MLPGPSSRNSRYLASSSDARPVTFAKNRASRKAKIKSDTKLIVGKSKVFFVKGENIKPSARTVPRSLMKQAARIAWPYVV